MWNALIDNDPTGQIRTAYIAKEELRQRLSAARDGADDAEIGYRLYRFYIWCVDADIPQTDPAGDHHRDVVAGDPGVLAHRADQRTPPRATTGWSNRSQRVACGVRNTENSRRRIRFHCTRAQRASIQHFHCVRPPGSKSQESAGAHRRCRRHPLLIEYLTKRRLSYSVGFSLTDTMVSALDLVPEQAWTPATIPMGRSATGPGSPRSPTCSTCPHGRKACA